MKTVQIDMGYHQQGNDINDHLDFSITPSNSFKEYAERMEDAIRTARTIQYILEDCDEAYVFGDTHTITIEAPDRITDRLLKYNFAKELIGEVKC